MTVTRATGVLAGSSHLVCFGVQLATEDGQTALSPLKDGNEDFLCLNGPFPRDKHYWRELLRLAADYKVFIVWRGNQHATQLFASDPPFDFVLSDQPELPVVKDSIIIPEQMLRKKFSPTLDELEVLLENLAEVARHGVVICGTPPPKGDVTVIRATLNREKYFAERLAALGSSADLIPLISPAILYKMWRLIQNMLRELAGRRQVQFVPVPAETQTSDGFLRREFWSSDVTHANNDFGRLFLRHLRKHL